MLPVPVMSRFFGSTRFSMLVLLGLALVLRVNSQAYVLDTEYRGATFFNGWDFFTEGDPTNGFVSYVDSTTAVNSGLIAQFTDGGIYMGVDSTTVLTSTGPGRESVRISSQKTWTHALVLLDLDHMPGSICGVWPAFWMLGPNWPTDGEIDIIEGVNANTYNLMSLHSSPNCSVTQQMQTGVLQTENCDSSVNFNSGCGTTSSSAQSYGSGLNDVDGGVYAMEWTSTSIKFWFFPRGTAPADISGTSPDPTGWGEPAAFYGNALCDIDTHFGDLQLVFDTTFCGDWAGNVWTTGTCAASTGVDSCVDYVAGNPSVFADAYWDINSLRVFQLAVASTTTSVVSPSITANSSIQLSQRISRTANIAAASAVPVVPLPIIPSIADPGSPTYTASALPNITPTGSAAPGLNFGQGRSTSDDPGSPTSTIPGAGSNGSVFLSVLVSVQERVYFTTAVLTTIVEPCGCAAKTFNTNVVTTTLTRCGCEDDEDYPAYATGSGNDYHQPQATATDFVPAMTTSDSDLYSQTPAASIIQTASLSGVSVGGLIRNTTSASPTGSAAGALSTASLGLLQASAGNMERRADWVWLTLTFLGGLGGILLGFI